MLKTYNVRPIEYFTMLRDQDGKIDKAKFKKPMTYGYFTADGDVIKLYQPRSDKHKFYNINNHVQDYDQLKYSNLYLVIFLSLKFAIS